MLKILLVTVSMSVTSATVADRSRLITKIKQLVPKVQTAMAVGVTCLVSICALQFSTPASAEIHELNSRMEVLRRRNTFLHLANLDGTKGTRVVKWLGAGGVVEQENFLLFEAGLDVQTWRGLDGNPLNFFLNGRLKKQVDDANIEPEIRAGTEFLMYHNYSYGYNDGMGYINAEAFLTKENLRLLALRLYLFYEQVQGDGWSYCVLGLPIDEATGMGYEYFSGENEKLLGTEELNGHLFSLIRISKSSEGFYDVGIVRKGYNITYGGGVFHYGESTPHVHPNGDTFYHEDTKISTVNKRFIGGSFVRVGAHLDYFLYAGRLNIGFAGENKAVVGKEALLETSLNMTTEIVVSPKHDIRLEANLHIINQVLITMSGTEKLHDDDRGGSVMFLLKKGFD